jgi:hypothetical protein
MNEKQQTDWQLLESVIDLDRYWESVPVTLLEIGVVTKITVDGWEVVWLDGHRHERISVEQTVAEFAAFQAGQWFEALVERQPKTFALRKLRYVRPTDSLREMTEEEFQQWLGSLPSGQDLPKSGSDWTTL